MPHTYIPPAIRGSFYSTAQVARCPEFHQCRRCDMCAHFNRHNPFCQLCETRKPGNRHCDCTHEQQAAMVFIENRLGRPHWDINARPGTVEMADGIAEECSEAREMIRKLSSVQEIPD